MSNSWFNWPSSLTRFVRFDAARSEDVNTALDEVSTAFDGVETKTNAAIKGPDGESNAAIPAKASRINKVLTFDASGNAVTTYAIADVATVSGIAANVTTVAGIAANVTTVAGIAADVTAVAADAADIGIVAAANAAIGTVATNIASVNTVAGVSGNVTTVAGIAADVTAVAGIAADVAAVENIAASVTTVAGDSADIATVAGISADVSAVAGVASDVSAVAAQFIGWNFSTTTTMADPGSGIMRFNNATIASVTAIAFDDLNSAAADVSAYVLTWDDATSTNKGTLTIRQGTANYAIFNVTGLTDNAGWTEIAVTHVSSSGTFTNAVLTFVDFDRTGDAGTGDFLANGSVPMTGSLTLSGAGTGIIFEGTTADAYETTLIAGEPTADRTITFPDETMTVGFRNVPIDSFTSGTLTTALVGKCPAITGAVTIPDATFAAGDVVSLFNNTSGTITITCTITTAYIAGTDSDKATMTLAARGLATILFLSGTVCVVQGNVS